MPSIKAIGDTRTMLSTRKESPEKNSAISRQISERNATELLQCARLLRNQWRREGGGASAPGGTVQGRHLEGQKYGILKFGRFWRIGVMAMCRDQRVGIAMAEATLSFLNILLSDFLNTS